MMNEDIKTIKQYIKTFNDRRLKEEYNLYTSIERPTILENYFKDFIKKEIDTRGLGSMKKEKTLLRFRIYDGDREYTDYAIIDNKQLLTLNYKEIISKFFYDDKVNDEQFLSDGRAVRVESEIPITDLDVKKLENLSMAFLHDFKLKEIA
jgi:hypothetical protein